MISSIHADSYNQDSIKLVKRRAALGMGGAGVIEVRQIVSRAELEQCYDIWGTVFSVGRAFFQTRLDFDRSYDYETTWGAWVDGKLASAIQIFPYRARYGSVQLKIGGIGSVATLPEFRHRGLAQLILRQQIQWMRMMQFDLSLLFAGIPEFYRQLGWHSIPMGANYTFEPTVPIPTDPTYTVRPGDFQTDLPALIHMYDTAEGGAALTRVRTREYWEDSMGWTKAAHPQLFIAEHQGQAVAYLITYEGEEGTRPVECLALPDHSPAAVALLRHFLDNEAGSTAVTVKLPDDHPWAKYGTRGEEDAGEMWRYFDLVQLLSSAAPELSRRLQSMNVNEPTIVTLALEDVIVRLRLQGGEVNALPPVPAHLFSDKIHILKGHQVLHLVVTGSDGVTRERCLQGLFPLQTLFLWPMDHF
jgi:GNAT superfamily N-acetyltransferase